jgi:hypothetical protein
MRATLCSIFLLLAGCATVTDTPGSWLTREGSLADPQDYADCLSKARYTEQLASSRVAVQDLPRTDDTILAICMDAHGYRTGGPVNTASGARR